MDELLMLRGLNAAQRAAVTSPANVVQILAPPGSGKTKTLTSRVAYLLQHNGIAPGNIVCLTFTIKSAREMRERLAKLLGNGLERRLILGTFHSVCLRYLRAYGHYIGLDRAFAIADAADSLAIITRITKRLKLLMDPKTARARISMHKAKSMTLTQIRPSKLKTVDQQEFVTIFEAYEAHLALSNLLDYDDLLLRSAELLRVRPQCVSNVEAVLIDEFQDTNHIQFELMRLFAAQHQRVTTVGDPDQSIYGWRSADITNLRRMQRIFPDTLVVHLEENYRSAGAILSAALKVIEQDASRPAKPLLPTHKLGSKPVLRRLCTAAVEASWIVEEIERCKALTGETLAYDDFAILLRSAALSRQIEMAMSRNGMPYRMVGGMRFFDRVEIKILLDYLRVVNQPDNTDAVIRILNVPSRRIGDATRHDLLEEAAAKSVTLWQLLRDIVQGHTQTRTKITKSTGSGLDAFHGVIISTRERIDRMQEAFGPKDVLNHVIKKLDFQQYLERQYAEDHETRWANVEELLAQASDQQDSPPRQEYAEEDLDLPSIQGTEQARGKPAWEALNDFLSTVALSTEIQRNDEELDNAGQPKARVTISTIHAAKGLEWPVVFVPSVFQGSIPHSRAEDWDEERRLLYVAMTRAQALLNLSYPVRNSLDGETTLSSFISKSLMDRYMVEKGPTLSPDVVAGICSVLGRPTPTPTALANGFASLDHTEDEQWSVEGDAMQEATYASWIRAKRSDFSSSFNPRHQRPGRADVSKMQDATFATASSHPSLSVTMQDPSRFTIFSYTTESGGSRRLPSRRPGTVSLPAIGSSSHTVSTDFRKREALWNGTDGTKESLDPIPKRIKTKSAPASQASIATFFTGSIDIKDCSKAPISQTSATHSNDHAFSSLQTSDAVSGRAASRPILGETRPAKLNSASSRFQGRASISARESSRDVGKAKSLQKVSRPDVLIAQRNANARAAAHLPRATTELTTSELPNMGPSRKTLGVRRSMAGWSARTNR